MTVALTYHDLADGMDRDRAGFTGGTAARYKLSPDRFEAHLDAIAAAAPEVGLVAPDAPLPPVALTFDDGGASALAEAEAIERRGWRAHFFVVTSLIGTPGFLTADDIRELARRGHVVASHSHTHPTYMGKLSPARIDEEWRVSRAALADLLGEPPVLASVPGGFLSRAVVDGAAAAGYRVLLTSEPIVRVRSANRLLVLGRFTIWANTPAWRAGAYVRGAWGARSRLWVEWNVKKLAKISSPEAYESLRRRRAGL